MPKVTPLQIKNAQPKDKPYKIYDEQGLFMIVNPNGSKWWRLKYRFQGKEKTISLGVYPKISLKEARVKRNQHRLIIESKHDPSEVREEKKLKERSDHSFAHLALLWHKKKATNWTTKYSDSVLTRIKINLLPYIGKTDINDLTPKIMLEVLRKIELRGAIETAHRIRSIASQIFKFAIAMDICISDPTRDIGAALAVSPTKHYPSLTNPKDICILLHKIDKYPGSFTTRCALQLAALFFVRPGELAQAKWSEFDLNLKQWHIPAERMKMKSKHIVPLS